MKNIGYTSIALVLETWDAARFNSKEFDSAFGSVVLEKFLELEPRAKKVYEGDRAVDIHAKQFVKFFDSIFVLLGPDTDLVEDVLKQVGERHRVMGVKPSFFPFMGDALVHALEQFSNQPMSPEQKDAWFQVYEAISSEIIKAILL
mmetsp:Transcript_24326/g.67411  ORF Transcript_24326/g.67411 Transcript_24326/m.67411 type:complete len:146 (-) Transcript_24326:1366-1803(-)